jgi:hypothetical protein
MDRTSTRSHSPQGMKCAAILDNLWRLKKVVEDSFEFYDNLNFFLFQKSLKNPTSKPKWKYGLQQRW